MMFGKKEYKKEIKNQMKIRSKNIMIKNIIFDLGNVIVRGTHSSIIMELAKKCGLEKMKRKEYL